MSCGGLCGVEGGTLGSQCVKYLIKLNPRNIDRSVAGYSIIPLEGIISELSRRPHEKGIDTDIA